MMKASRKITNYAYYERKRKYLNAYKGTYKILCTRFGQIIRNS